MSVALLMLSACAASVKYAPRVVGITPGYVDQRLGERTFQVKIGEAWPKDFDDLEKFALYRAAEVTLSNGGTYFEVLSSSSRVTNYSILMPSSTITTGTATLSGNTAYIDTRSTTSGGGTMALSGGWYTMDYKVLTAKPTEGARPVVDAAQIQRDFEYFIESRR